MDKEGISHTLQERAAVPNRRHTPNHARDPTDVEFHRMVVRNTVVSLTVSTAGHPEDQR